MLFSTVAFVGFFIVAYFVFLAFRGRTRARKLVLLACSYWFYMAWNPPFVLILMFSTFLDFVAGKRIATAESRAGRSRWLLVSCAGNLGVLAFFKYADFIASNMWFMMPQTAEYPTFLQSIVLPLGISFYTFQSMSYTIDIYRGQLRPTKYISLLRLPFDVSSTGCGANYSGAESSTPA